MEDTILIRLLQIQKEQDRKTERFDPEMDLHYFDIDLLTVVLDVIGLPEEGSEAPILSQEDPFCRDSWASMFYDMVETGTPDECAAYISRVRKTYQSYLERG